MTAYKNIIISMNKDSYGISTDAQVAAVKKRIEIISNHMSFPYRYADTQIESPCDSHPDTELIFELAMDCTDRIPYLFRTAVERANRDCPIPCE